MGSRYFLIIMHRVNYDSNHFKKKRFEKKQIFFVVLGYFQKTQSEILVLSV